MENKDMLILIVWLVIVVAIGIPIPLLGVMIFAGIIMGIMFNISLSRKFYESGGVIGGAVVGLLMYILGGGFAV
jgi:hypothetical protein